MDQVLANYPAAVARVEWVPLGAAGGFSGSSLWRGQLNGEPLFALKAWPVGFPAERLESIHRWMKQARDGGLGQSPFAPRKASLSRSERRLSQELNIVPAVVPTLVGTSFVELSRRIWDITAWLPGIANFESEPTDAKLTASCEAIAKLHKAWEPRQPHFAPCPGVERRIALLRGFDPNRAIVKIPDPQLCELLSSTLPTLRLLVALALAVLKPWGTQPGPVQPCLCDVWHDHILFTGDAVSGVIDYGSMKLDHPAVDLARWLGDTVGDDRERMELGLAAYRDAGGSWMPDVDFVSCLDKTGTICAVIHWIQRLSSVEAPVDTARVNERVRKLVARLHAIELQMPTRAARIETSTILIPRPARGEP